MSTRQKAVMDGVLQYVSPSQITTFLGCPRQWHFDKVQHISPPEKPFQGVGQGIHKQAEDYFEHGHEPEHPSVKAALALPGVPARDPQLLIEEPSNYDLGLTAAGLPVQGKIDLFIPPGVGNVDSYRFRILDWKSCKTFDYIHSPETLTRNTQGIIYLQHGFIKYRDASWADFSHVYISTGKRPGARIVSTDPMSRNQVAELYEEVTHTVSEMKQVASERDVNHVPFDKSTCSKYGGCPYQGICSVSRFDPLNIAIPNQVRKSEEEETMSEPLSSLAQKLRARAGGVINPPDATKPEPVKPYEPPGTATLTVLNGIQDQAVPEFLAETLDNALKPNLPTEVDKEALTDKDRGLITKLESAYAEIGVEVEARQAEFKRNQELAEREERLKNETAGAGFTLCIDTTPIGVSNVLNLDEVMYEVLVKHFEQNPIQTSGFVRISGQGVGIRLAAHLVNQASAVFQGEK